MMKRVTKEDYIKFYKECGCIVGKDGVAYELNSKRARRKFGYVDMPKKEKK
jgi:hypothetical protein